MNVLVTGFSGMLGTSLGRVLEKKHRLLGVSQSGRNGVACDLADPASLKPFESQSIGLVIHTAAYSDVDGCENDPARAYASNVLAVKHLAAFCGERKIPWIHVSTDYVFSGQNNKPYVESDRTFPISIYGITKWIGEWYALHSASPCALVRTSWLFGPDNPRTFVNAIAARLKKEGAVSVLDNQTTAPTSVKDLSLALERISERLLDKGRSETFHVCNRGGATHLEIARAVREALNLEKARVERTDVLPNRPALRPKYSVMSPAHFESTLGMKMRPWQESLREYLQEKVSCAS